MNTKLNQYLTAALLIMTFVQCTDQQKKVESKPNIVFILADDLGYGDLSCYGQQRYQTPNIDKLAAEGMRFTQFYSGTSVCAPSRSALMSGQHTGHTFIRGNKEIYPEGQQAIPDSVNTIAENLKNSGYSTGAFGKWGLGFVGTEGDPNKQGFDTFYGYNCQRESHRYYPGHLWHNNNRVVLKGNDNLKNKVTYAPDLIQEQALAFIEKNKNNPFFLYLPYTLPHAELEVPNDSIFAKFDGKFPESPYKGQDYGPDAKPMGYTSQDKPHATFAAMVTRLDMYVGQVMERLTKLGLAENTLIIFTSDNGPHTEGGADPLFFNGSGGLRGVKRDLYEGGIRVPFIARWPGKIKENTSSDYVGAFWDVYPTLSQISGNKKDTYADGISIVPTLLAQSNQEDHPYLYWEFLEMGGRQAVRKGDWKAVRLNIKKGTEVIELYNLKNDVSETVDVADKHPEIMKDMVGIMNAAHTESEIFPLFGN